MKVKRKTRSRADDRIIPTKDEIRIIIETAPETHRALFITAIFTGMRISELRGLTWDAVDFDRSLIRVVQRADEFNEIGPPKSKAGISSRMRKKTSRCSRSWSAVCSRRNRCCGFIGDCLLSGPSAIIP